MAVTGYKSLQNLRWLISWKGQIIELPFGLELFRGTPVTNWFKSVRCESQTVTHQSVSKASMYPMALPNNAQVE